MIESPPETAPREREAEALAGRIDKGALPRHIAVIMDGNGRWARARGKGRIEGHRAGIRSVREVVTTCRELGVEVLTLYAFSSENWKRPPLEVRALMGFLEDYLARELDTLVRNDIRLATIGDLTRLPPSVRRALERLARDRRLDAGDVGAGLYEALSDPLAVALFRDTVLADHAVDPARISTAMPMVRNARDFPQ